MNAPSDRIGAFDAPVGVAATPLALEPVDGLAPGAVAAWPDVVTFDAWERDPGDVQVQLKVARAAWVADMAEARKLGVEVDEDAAWHDWRHWMQFYAPLWMTGVFVRMIVLPGRCWRWLLRKGATCSGGWLTTMFGCWVTWWTDWAVWCRWPGTFSHSSCNYLLDWLHWCRLPCLAIAS